MHSRAATVASLASLTAIAFVSALVLACGRRLDLVEPTESSDGGDGGVDASTDDVATDSGDAHADAKPPSGACKEARFEGVMQRTTLGYPTRAARSADFVTWFYADAVKEKLTVFSADQGEEPWLSAITTRGELPTISLDQRFVIFQRTAGGPAGTNVGGLSFATRGSTTASFTEAGQMKVDPPFDDLEIYEPYLVEDGGERFVYFAARRANGVRALYEGKLETRMGGTWLGGIQTLAAISGTALGFPLVSRDRREIFFADGLASAARVRHASREDAADSFDTPTDVAFSNPVGEPRPVELSADGCTLVVIENGSNTTLTWLHREK